MDDIRSEEKESFDEMVGKAFDATIEQLGLTNKSIKKISL